MGPGKHPQALLPDSAIDGLTGQKTLAGKVSP